MFVIKKLLSIQETLEILQLEAEELQNMMADKQIPFVIQNGQVMFPSEQVNKIRMDKMASPTIKLGPGNLVPPKSL